MISVITPCKNIISGGRQSFFQKMVATLYKQTYQDFEHILVDGDSEDETADLLQKHLRNGHIDTLISEKDNNLYEAINKGLKIAKGEYIHVMTTDDYFATNGFFEKSLEAMEKYKVDFTHADRIIIKRDGGKPSIKRGDERTAFFRMPFRYQTMLIRKNIYDELGPFDEKFEIASDYKFMLKMLLADKKGYYFPKIFIHSLEGGVSANRQKCIKEVTQVLFECYGKKYSLTIKDCRNIYQKKISPDLFSKILSNVKDKRILESLKYCYEHERIA